MAAKFCLGNPLSWIGIFCWVNFFQFTAHIFYSHNPHFARLELSSSTVKGLKIMSIYFFFIRVEKFCVKLYITNKIQPCPVICSACLSTHTTYSWQLTVFPNTDQMSSISVVGAFLTHVNSIRTQYVIF